MNLPYLLIIIVFVNMFFFNDSIKTIKRHIFFNKYETTTLENAVNLGKIYDRETKICELTSTNSELFLEHKNNYCYLMAVGNLTKNVTSNAKVENEINVQLIIQVIDIKRTVEANSVTLRFPEVTETKFVSLFQSFREVVRRKLELETELQILVFGIHGGSSIEVTISICKIINDANSLLNTSLLTEKFHKYNQEISDELKLVETISIVNTTCDNPPKNCSGSCMGKVSFEPKCEIEYNGLPQFCPNSKVLQENDITLVILDIHLKAICQNERTLKMGCGPNTCLNGGYCNQHFFDNGSKCTCPTGFDGPRCQQLIHSYEKNSSYSIYDPLPSFFPEMNMALLHISFGFTFKTLIKKGISTVLYSGPIGKSDISKDDYLIIRFNEDFPEVLLSFEERKVELKISRQNNVLIDNQWHNVDLIFDEKNVSLIIDGCRDKNEDCFISKPILKELRFNRYPLQLGGRRKISNSDSPDEKTAPFDSLGDLCIQNLRINGELYDMHINEAYGSHQNSSNQCQSRNFACGFDDVTQLTHCGKNGICHSIHNQEKIRQSCFCACKVNYRPEFVKSIKPTCNLKCDFETSIISLKGNDSYMTWTLSDLGDIKSWEFSFRTFAAEGTIFSMKNDYKSYFLFLLQKGFLKFVYKTDEANDEKLSFPHLNALNDGFWHRILLRKSDQNLEIIVDDGGEGGYFYMNFFLNKKKEISLQKFFGIGSTFGQNFLIESSCFKDIRVNNFYIPLNSKDDNFAAKINENRTTEINCFAENKCAVNPCPVKKPVCQERWRSYSCSCAKSQVLVKDDTCILYDGCTMGNRASQCKNNALCKWNTTRNIPECICTRGWKGQFCDLYVIEPTVGPNKINPDFQWYYILLIALIVLLILVAILVFIIISRRSMLKEKERLITDFPGLERINETFINYCEDGAGEEDYTKPLPILPLKHIKDALPDSYILSPETEKETYDLTTKDVPQKTAEPVNGNDYEEEFIDEELPDETLAYEFEADILNTKECPTDNLSEIYSSILNEDEDDESSFHLENLHEWGENFQHLANYFNVPPNHQLAE